MSPGAVHSVNASEGGSRAAACDARVNRAALAKLSESPKQYGHRRCASAAALLDGDSISYGDRTRVQLDSGFILSRNESR